MRTDFVQLITKLNDQKDVQFVGYGNPDANILIIGKECARNLDESKEFRDVTYNGNLEQWKDICSNPCFKKENIPNWNENNLAGFSPLSPFKGSRFMRNYNNNGGTSPTWMNYQKLFNLIKGKDILDGKYETLTFLDHCFITEMNGIPSSMSPQKNNAVESSVEERAQNLLSDNYFKHFPIIILAAGSYPTIYRKHFNIKAVFDVDDDPTKNIYCGKGQWANYYENAAERRLLLHTRQLSMNVSNSILIAMSDTIRDFILKKKLETP